MATAVAIYKPSFKDATTYYVRKPNVKLVCFSLWNSDWLNHLIQSNNGMIYITRKYNVPWEAYYVDQMVSVTDKYVTYKSGNVSDRSVEDHYLFMPCDFVNYPNYGHTKN
jgi:hypothetical protein